MRCCKMSERHFKQLAQARPTGMHTEGNWPYSSLMSRTQSSAAFFVYFISGMSVVFAGIETHGDGQVACAPTRLLRGCQDWVLDSRLS